MAKTRRKPAEKGIPRSIWLGPDLDPLVMEHARNTGEDLSSMVRRLLATEVGKPELATAVKLGRPRKEEAD